MNPSGAIQLSIIIVNYNVPHFLEQCLYSVEKALENLSGEIIVIDNHSTDNSLAFLAPLFPGVQFIQNRTNEGFGRANNKGLSQAKGKFILFLNPDTLVCDDTFRLCISFMNQHPEAGALGVRMVDGNGRFLKESKRSFPDPMASLYKLSGLARTFPSSAQFARYHLGHLPENQTAEVDVLAGAFMLVRKEVLDETGGFDPQFFMYGEDIDLSFRIQKAGYKNYYYPETTIIHFKGESTKKGSLNYVRMFYQAMNLFVEKHYSGGRVGLFRRAIQMGIWGRAVVSALRRFLLKAGLPLLDAALLFLSFFTALGIWENFIKEITYSRRVIISAALACTFIAWIIHYWSGLYDSKQKYLNILKSAVLQVLVVLSIYSLLPETLRFSRGMLVSSQLIFYVFTWLLRWLLIRSRVLQPAETPGRERPALVLGSGAEMERIQQLISRNEKSTQVIGRISPDNLKDPYTVGSLYNAASWKNTVYFEEIICCFGETPLKVILSQRGNFPSNVSYMYSFTGSASMVGSDSSEKSGESVSIHGAMKLATPLEQRNKRLTDVLVSVGLLLAFPFLALLIRGPFQLLKNCLLVISGTHTWVGYAGAGKGLPPLPPGILTVTGRPAFSNESIAPGILSDLNSRYAGNYSFSRDLQLIRIGIYWLGAKNQ